MKIVRRNRWLPVTVAVEITISTLEEANELGHILCAHGNTMEAADFRKFVKQHLADLDKIADVNKYKAGE